MIEELLQQEEEKNLEFKENSRKKSHQLNNTSIL